MKSSSSFKSLNFAWSLANAMETVKRRSRARRKSMFTSQKDTNAERKTSSKLELFSVSLESNYAVALVLFFVCFLLIFFGGRGGVTGSKFVPSIKNIVREICISSCEEKYPGRYNGKLFFSNPKGDVCECSGNNINLSECQRDISRHVQAYGLGINRDEISDKMDLILCRAGK